MFSTVFFFVVFHFVASKSNQEDLFISNYSHIGCLILNPDKQFISDGGIQENSRSPYQSFSSPNLTIDLCFRLCRQWVVLMNSNHTNCICLYVSNELYEMNEHLGEVLPKTNCTASALEIYSLAKHPYILPKPKPTDDWSFEGCFRVDGLQVTHTDKNYAGKVYQEALISCRDRCQSNSTTNYSSFFLSFQRICYCLGKKRVLSNNITTIRKPLVHCSFLPYVKNALNNSFDETLVNPKTVAKINVQRYCSSSFVFNRTLYRCFKSIQLNKSDTYSKITTNEACSPISIRTIEGYNYLLVLLPSSPSRTFISISRNSTYLFDDLFKSKVDSLSPGDLCLVINRTQSSSSPPDLVSCSMAQSSDYIFCTQKPMAEIDQSEFKSVEPIPVLENITCPADFILFDNLCYYVFNALVYDIRAGERICSEKYPNSSVVKFDSHEVGNVNTTRILGRTHDDILLEFFYYQLEQKLIDGTNSSKHWLRLLIGDKNDEKGCFLRYFSRLTGGFNVSINCNQGGHSVCQCQPISINETITNSSGIDPSYLILSNETPDEDLDKNRTYSNSTSETKHKPYVKHKSRFTIAIVSITVIAFVTTIFILHYRRKDPRPYSTQNGRKALSTSVIRDETSNTATVHYTRLPTTSSTNSTDLDMINVFDNAIVIDDQVDLLPQSTQSTKCSKKC